MKKKVHNLLIIDESGSMNVVRDATISGINQLIEQIKKSQGEYLDQEHFVSLVTFNEFGVKYRFFNQPVQELILMNQELFQPNGLTPLYDAVCKSVLKLKHDLYYAENYSTLVTIITDGQENSSSEFSYKETKLIINELSKNPNWIFGLIGANIDVEMTAELLGIPIKRTISFQADNEGVNQMFSRYNKAQENFSEILFCEGDIDELPF